MAFFSELWDEIRSDNKRNKFDRAMSTAGIVLLGLPGCLITGDRVLNNENKINGYEKLDAAISYLSEYDGANPAEAIRNAYEIVETVEGMNPGEEHIIELEAKLTSTEKQLGDTANPLVYEPILGQAATDINRYRMAHDRSWVDYFFWLMITPSVLFYGSAVAASYFPTAEQRAERNNNSNIAKRKQRYDNDLHNNDEFRNNDN